jgi:hypothetical protein
MIFGVKSGCLWESLLSRQLWKLVYWYYLQILWNQVCSLCLAFASPLMNFFFPPLSSSITNYSSTLNSFSTHLALKSRIHRSNPSCLPAELCTEFCTMLNAFCVEYLCILILFNVDAWDKIPTVLNLCFGSHMIGGGSIQCQNSISMVHQSSATVCNPLLSTS